MTSNEEDYKPPADRQQTPEEPIEEQQESPEQEVQPLENSVTDNQEETPETEAPEEEPTPLENEEPEPEPEPEPPISPEFEVAGSSKFFTFFAAVRDVLLNPAEFFSLLTVRNGIGYPLVFGILVYFINSLGSVFFSLLEIALGINFGLPEQVFASAMSVFITPLVSLFFAPIAILVIAIIYHVLLMIFKFDSAGFEGTLRVICYASAPLVLGIIPLCGGIVGFFWSLVVTIIGFQLVCKMSTGWAILIYFIPLIFFCSCIGMVMGLGGLAAFMTIMPELNHMQEFLQEV